MWFEILSCTTEYLPLSLAKCLQALSNKFISILGVFSLKQTQLGGKISLVVNLS